MMSLAEMRNRIHQLRTQFVDTMKTSGVGHDFSFLLPQNGMFSYSGLNQNAGRPTEEPA